ncbi:FERM domain containing 8 [Homo sapiens]|uniref:FERM domain containing 8 n=1 Tax=Homo sapiens TaxID=9606 RepID=Q8N4M4_HUMAN
MDGTEGSAGQPGPAERSHRSSVSSVGARGGSHPHLLFHTLLGPQPWRSSSGLSSFSLKIIYVSTKK